MGTIGADIVLKTLAEEGVEVIFGYPGPTPCRSTTDLPTATSGTT